MGAEPEIPLGVLGFTIATFLLLFLAMALLGQGRWMKLYLSLAAALSISGCPLFIVAFQTRFPFGLFKTAVAALF